MTLVQDERNQTFFRDSERQKTADDDVWNPVLPDDPVSDDPVPGDKKLNSRQTLFVTPRAVVSADAGPVRLAEFEAAAAVTVPPSGYVIPTWPFDLHCRLTPSSMHGAVALRETAHVSLSLRHHRRPIRYDGGRLVGRGGMSALDIPVDSVVRQPLDVWVGHRRDVMAAVGERFSEPGAYRLRLSAYPGHYLGQIDSGFNCRILGIRQPPLSQVDREQLESKRRLVCDAWDMAEKQLQDQPSEAGLRSFQRWEEQVQLVDQLLSGVIRWKIPEEARFMIPRPKAKGGVPIKVGDVVAEVDVVDHVGKERELHRLNVGWEPYPSSTHLADVMEDITDCTVPAAVTVAKVELGLRALGQPKTLVDFVDFDEMSQALETLRESYLEKARRIAEAAWLYGVCVPLVADSRLAAPYEKVLRILERTPLSGVQWLDYLVDVSDVDDPNRVFAVEETWCPWRREWLDSNKSARDAFRRDVARLNVRRPAWGDIDLQLLSTPEVVDWS